jgi:hypothetical protein
MHQRLRWITAATLGIALLGLVGWFRGSPPIGYQAVPRDAFPVFDDPKMVTAAEAEGFIQERDMVIGVARGREARAYPIAVMGIHELGNDTIDGVPIAVSW